MIPRAEHLLNPSSILSRTLESLANSELLSILVSTNSLSALTPPLYDAADFVFLNQSRSAVWRDTLRNYFPDMKLVPSKHRAGAFSIFSPNSVHVGSAGRTITCEYWDHICTNLRIERGTSIRGASPNRETPSRNASSHYSDRNERVSEINERSPQEQGERTVRVRDDYRDHDAGSSWSNLFAPVIPPDRERERHDGTYRQPPPSFRRRDRPGWSPPEVCHVVCLLYQTLMCD